jgi:hypothetical protein
MKEFNLTSPFTGEIIPVTVSLKKYNNGRTAIELLENDLETGPVPYAVATVNMPDVLLADNEVLIKDYSENEGVLDFLIRYNIVTPTPNGIHSGFVWIPVAILNDESVWGEVPRAYCMNEEPEYYNLMPPPPDEINLDTGKCMWIIKDYRIWASSYQEAVELLPLIESF